MIPSWPDIVGYVEALYKAPFWLTSALFSFLICCFLRKSKAFPNRFIPLTCMVICSVLGALMAPHNTAETKMLSYWLTCFVVSGILGALVWGAHKAFIRPLEDKYPWLKKLLGGIVDDEDTARYPNPITGQPVDPPKP